MTRRASTHLLLLTLLLGSGWLLGQTLAPLPVAPIPSARQLAWHDLRYYAFVHFGPNTFTDKEWGHGDEPEDAFHPTALDCRQWARVAKEAGMEGIVLTVKHHDGFCLWPSAFSTHTVKESAWKGGKGDVLRELSTACKEYGLRLGVYMSPWDRNNPTYGTPAYNDVFKNQLREVLTQYGDIFEVWFDGACGEGPNGKRQVYDFHGFWDLVRQLQPEAVMFSDAGPDIRWVGNESGFAGATNWCSINSFGWVPGQPDVNEQLQSGHEGGHNWIPAEVDVSIRPGWFYHKNEDEKVKSVEKLVEIYFSSVGNNANLLLNLPVDTRGLVHENDVQALMGLKKHLDDWYSVNVLKNAPSKASNVRGKSKVFAADKAVDGDKNTYWATDDGVTAASLELTVRSKQPLHAILLQEYIPLGQRVKKFSVEAWDGKTWVPLGRGSTIGNRRILRFPPMSASKIRLNIEDSRACPLISNIEAYAVPR